jgi:ABC-type sugar transport system ATPase subunit
MAATATATLAPAPAGPQPSPRQGGPGAGPGNGRFQLREVVVDFGPNRAIDHVSLDIQPGEIAGLLGHNGAGKSTIVNLASGAIKWTRGKVLIDGVEVPRGSSPGDLAARGVTVIHQEPSLIAGLTVFDNLCLAHRFSNLATRQEIRDAATTALHSLGVDADLDTPVAALTLGQRQMVDLARGSLAGDTRVLLLDEPAAALGMAETRKLHKLIREYARKGAAVVYVSHRLPDILDVCGRIVVLNSGRVVLDRPAEGLSLADLTESLSPGMRKVAKAKPASVTPLLHATTPCGAVRAGLGEVVGLFGMAAGEQFEIAAALFGLGHCPVDAKLRGEPYQPKGPADAMRRKVAYVPPDRDIDGLIGHFSGKDNVLLPWNKPLGGRWWLPKRFQQQVYDDSYRELHVLGPGGATPISQFSGGNRQKQLLARWIFPSPCDLLVLAQPTQGVDVGAKTDIVRVVRRIAAENTAVVVASSETDEIVAMCDRAYVVYGSRSAEVAGAGLTDENLLAALLQLADKAHP